MTPKFTPNVGNYPVYNNHNKLLGALYSHKSFKGMFAAANCQMISLRLEYRKRNEGNDQVRKCESEVVTCECHRDSEQNKTKTENQQKLQEL